MGLNLPFADKTMLNDAPHHIGCRFSQAQWGGEVLVAWQIVS